MLVCSIPVFMLVLLHGSLNFILGIFFSLIMHEKFLQGRFIGDLVFVVTSWLFLMLDLYFNEKLSCIQCIHVFQEL